MTKTLLFSISLFLNIIIASAQTVPCSGGMAGGFPCNGLDLQSTLSLSAIGGAGSGNDSWGWTDPMNGNEYAIMGLTTGTAFIDISDPINPVYLGILPTHTSNSSWRDIKTYDNHAFVVSEAPGHGMQVFDLTRLRTVASPPETFTEDAHYNGFGDSHNIAINEDSGYAYVIGANTCSGGPVMINIQNPTNPVFEGCFSADGYTHDAQIVTYHGPDNEHYGKEILIASNEDTVTVVDVTDKSNPIQLSRSGYAGSRYTHQGWLTGDHKFYIFDDELDESNNGHDTRTYMMDFSDLDNPSFMGYYESALPAIDHNGYVKGNRFYMANYRAGVRVLDITDISNANLTEVASFDTYPTSNNANFNGTWNVYPYFSSGNLVVSNIEDGLFILKDPNYDAIPPVAVCQNITATLDTTGKVVINPADLDGGSTDNVLVYDYRIDRSTTFTCKDAGVNNVTFTVFDGNYNKSTCSATITILAETTTYNGSWDNGVPTIGSTAKFSANYDTNTADIEACICEIDPTVIVTVGPDEYINIENNITNNGTLIVESIYDVATDRVISGSVVQQNENAVYINNGATNIDIATPRMSGRDFMLMGSPMSAETRADAFSSALRVRNHLTGNFTPNAAVAATSPGAGNWVDEEGDNWPVYNGAINPGEGYMVMQSLSGGPTSYTMTYDKGTLNSGAITYSALYNGTQNGSPNIIANPYASAISAEDFITANAGIVDAVYFWEHVTAPTQGTPGPYYLDYTMEDISIFNLTGGTAAAGSDGTTTPNGVISTGQGFGIKAKAAGNITFSNAMRRNTGNTTLRSQTNRDRIWLTVQSDRYDLKSTALIGFMEDASDAIDEGYDAKRLATNVSLYSHLPDGSDQLGIQARGTFEDNVKIPIGFSTLVDETASYTISIQDIEGENLSNMNVYLIDNQENVLWELSNESYTFESSRGINDGRFTIQFARILSNPDSVLDTIKIYPNPTSNIINIISSNTKIISAEVYGIRGRVVDEVFFDSETANQLDISHLDTAVYFVKINTNYGTVTKRVIKY